MRPVINDSPVPPIILHGEQAIMSTDRAGGWVKPLTDAMLLVLIEWTRSRSSERKSCTHVLHLPVEKSGEGASAVAAAMPGSWRWNNNELCVHSMRGMRYSLLLVARGVAPYISIGGRPDTDYLARRTHTGRFSVVHWANFKMGIISILLLNKIFLTFCT